MQAALLSKKTGFSYIKNIYILLRNDILTKVIKFSDSTSKIKVILTFKILHGKEVAQYRLNYNS